jgi:hypothetical protein
MNHILNNVIIICYPGGTGGSFLASNLNSTLWDKEFKVNLSNGNCHQNINGGWFKNFEHGPTRQSLDEELRAITANIFVPSGIWPGHFRNLVAIKERIEQCLGFHAAQQATFVKIDADPNNRNHSIFLCHMLRNKANAFPEMNDEDFLRQTNHYIKNWYWVENFYTRNQTIDLDLKDVFSQGLENKFNHLLTEPQCEHFRKNHQYWLDINKHLYPDILRLLYE